jgi:MFS family permease
MLGGGPLGTFTAAHLLATAGDAFVTVSLAGSIFFNVSPDASRGQVLLYLTLTMAPFAVLTPFVGPVIDRFRSGHRVLASAIFVLRAACAVALAFTLFDLTFYVLALALLVASKASGVLRQALVPRLVDEPAHLVAANSHLARLGTVVGGIAGASAVLLLTATSAAALLAVAAGTFVAASLVVLRLPAGRTSVPVPSAVEYAELHTTAVLVASAGLMALRAGVGYFVFMLAFALRREGEPAWVYGLAVAAYGVGSFAGNVVAPRLRRRLHEERLMAASLAACAAVSAIGLLGVSRPTLLVIAVVFGLAATVGRQSFDALLQRTAPDALRGQAFARYETRFQLTWVLGGVLATAITLPVEVSMAVLLVLFVPVVVLFVRGATDLFRFEPWHHPDSLAPAQARLADALEWQSIGRHRHALVDLAAAVDLARASGAVDVDDSTCARLDELRRRAVDPATEVTAHDVAGAVALVQALVAGPAGLNPAG